MNARTTRSVYHPPVPAARPPRSHRSTAHRVRVAWLGAPCARAGRSTAASTVAPERFDQILRRFRPGRRRRTVAMPVASTTATDGRLTRALDQPRPPRPAWSRRTAMTSATPDHDRQGRLASGACSVSYPAAVAIVTAARGSVHRRPQSARVACCSSFHILQRSRKRCATNHAHATPEFRHTSCVCLRLSDGAKNSLM